MGTRIDFPGASGRTYSFYPLEADGALKPVGVTYVIAERTKPGWRVLHVGDSNNLAQRDWEPHLARVRTSHPDAQLLIRLNISRSVREAEAADIAAATRAEPPSSGAEP